MHLAAIADEAPFDPILDVNVRAQIVASKSALPHLGKGGRIITIGSYFADRVPTSRSASMRRPSRP